MTPFWLHALISAVAALLGGLVGSWTTAFKWGRRWQELHDRVAANEKRLERGDAPVGDVPVIKARLETVIQELQEIKRELREDRRLFVPRTECDRRHEDAA